MRVRISFVVDGFMVEWWNDGMVEWWEVGRLKNSENRKDESLVTSAATTAFYDVLRG